MNTSKIASLREVTERLVKILNIPYAKIDLEQVANN